MSQHTITSFFGGAAVVKPAAAAETSVKKRKAEQFTKPTTEVSNSAAPAPAPAPAVVAKEQDKDVDDDEDAAMLTPRLSVRRKVIQDDADDEGGGAHCAVSNGTASQLTNAPSAEKDASPASTLTAHVTATPKAPVWSFFAPRKPSSALPAITREPEPHPAPPAAPPTTTTTASSGTASTIPADAVGEGPCADVGWTAGQPVPYLALSRVFERIEAISSRLAIVELLRDLFRAVIWLTPRDLLPCIYLSINRLAPEYEGLELGVGESILQKAVADAYGRTLAVVKSQYAELGDLGLVAKAAKTTQRTMIAPVPLQVAGVFRTLREIAAEKGHASQSKKLDRIRRLLVSCREHESVYLIRSLEGKLRIGLAQQTVLVALAHAVVYTPPNANPRVWDALRSTSSSSSASSSKKSSELAAAANAERLATACATVKSVYSELPSYDAIVPVLLEHGLEELPRRCFLTPGIPVKPMLAQPTKGITEVLDRFTGVPFTCEYKYDGERAQIHRLADGSTRIYSRNLEDHTSKYPDLLANLPHAVVEPHTRTFIVDCEAVAFDPKTHKLLPFQVLSTRARKDVQLADVRVHVQLFAFDCLFLNGESLVREPYEVRRARLHAAFRAVPDEFAFATHRDASDVEEIQAFLNEAIANSCEGLMIKTLQRDHIGSSYEPSKRSFKWLKVKKDYLQGMADSFDLVPIGAFYGRGKRTGTFGAYLLACYDDENEQYQSCCKVATGFSEEHLSTFTDQLKPHQISQPKAYYRVGDSVTPDVWFEPVQVWEVQCADLSISPAHKAAEGLVAAAKGISLRFPRFIRVRDDKKPEDATTSTQVADMYRKQNLKQQSGAIAGDPTMDGDEMDY